MHTPGNWSARFIQTRRAVAGGIWEIVTDDNCHDITGACILAEINDPMGKYRSLEENQANAYLMASAPALQSENARLRKLLGDARDAISHSTKAEWMDVEGNRRIVCEIDEALGTNDQKGGE